MSDAWQRLGIAPTKDEALIRKTYAQLIRQYRPDSHPIEFSAIRTAYESALEIVRSVPSSAAHDVDWLEADPPPGDGFTQASVDTIEAPPQQGWDDDIAMARLRDAMDNCDNTAALAWLTEQLPVAQAGTLDTLHDFEAALVQAILSHDAPPLLFIEACAKNMAWISRWNELTSVMGKSACARLGGLLELAREHRFSSQFASNPWQRYLFASPATPLPRIGRTPLLIRARKVADSWRQRCIELRVRGHLRALNPLALRHVEDERVQSADLKNACVLALWALLIAWKAPASQPSGWYMFLLGASAMVAGSGMRVAWRRIRRHLLVQRALPWLRKVGLALIPVSFLLALAQRELATVEWISAPAFAYKVLFFSYVFVLMLWLHWWGIYLYDDGTMAFKLKSMDSADAQWRERESGMDEVAEPAFPD